MTQTSGKGAEGREQEFSKGYLKRKERIISTIQREKEG